MSAETTPTPKRNRKAYDAKRYDVKKNELREKNRQNYLKNKEIIKDRTASYRALNNEIIALKKKGLFFSLKHPTPIDPSVVNEIVFEDKCNPSLCDNDDYICGFELCQIKFYVCAECGEKGFGKNMILHDKTMDIYCPSCKKEN